MMTLEIKPYEGAGGILFGMTPEQVRSIIGNEVKTFKKASSTRSFTDAFIGKGIHVYYDEDNKCEAIEFAAPSNPTFKGYKLIEIPFIEVKETFIVMDDKLEVDETGFTSPKYGIGVYVPTLKDSMFEPIQGVIAFKAGYYN